MSVIGIIKNDYVLLTMFSFQSTSLQPKNDQTLYHPHCLLRACINRSLCVYQLLVTSLNPDVALRGWFNHLLGFQEKKYFKTNYFHLMCEPTNKMLKKIQIKIPSDHCHQTKINIFLFELFFDGILFFK